LSDWNQITSFTINKNLLTIGKWALADNNYLKSFLAPKDCKLQTFEEGAFQNCIKLRTVYIPKSVLYIGPEAFGHCITITDVYYEGSESDWNNIIIREGNEYLTGEPVTLHYNSVFN
jgi:hypothetical protein